MGFAQAHAAINEERVVVLAGLVGHGNRGALCELIVGANDKVFKGVLRNKVGDPAGLTSRSPFSIVYVDLIVGQLALLLAEVNEFLDLS